jgi:S-(hydroxymethyl)glutathione dehydrogenase/alcohol dehydrogenase
MLGPQLDGSYRFHARGEDVGQMCMLGTFSPCTVVPAASIVKIDDNIPLEIAALVGCGVTTGYGAAVYTAGVRAGETVVVMGAGGVGMNAVQGARIAGAERIVVVDPVGFKREQSMEFGATDVAATVDEAWSLIADMTAGQLADAAIITTGVAESVYVAQALSLVGKRGRVVATAVAHPDETKVDMSLFELTLFEKQLRGCVFGSANPQIDIPRLLSLYRRGLLKLDELVTRTYALAEINEGYRDLEEGLNIRGVVHHA